MVAMIMLVRLLVICC